MCNIKKNSIEKRLFAHGSLTKFGCHLSFIHAFAGIATPIQHIASMFYVEQLRFFLINTEKSETSGGGEGKKGSSLTLGDKLPTLSALKHIVAVLSINQTSTDIKQLPNAVFGATPPICVFQRNTGRNMFFSALKSYLLETDFCFEDAKKEKGIQGAWVGPCCLVNPSGLKFMYF